MSLDAAVDHDALLRRHGLPVTAQRLAVLRAVSERPHSTADDSGFEIDEAEVIYWGRCPDCIATASVAPDA